MQQAVFPLPLKLLNLAGKVSGVVGVRGASLSPERLMRRARLRTNLGDFGPDDFREGLERLCESLEHEAQLTAFGRMIAQADLLLLLENRLKLIHAFKVNRELSGAPIKQPLFILGMPRTGTSLLHQLLSQDPDNRVPMTWETKYPFPPPRTQTYRSDPRIGRVARELKNVDRLIPEFKKMYAVGAEHPQECVSLTALNFTSMLFNTSYRVPGYQHWLDTGADVRGAYDLHYQFLQYLQSRHKARRWALMSPGHLWSMDELLERYPDARIVQTHRDPVKVLCSLSSLTATLRSLASDDVNIRDIARHQSELLAGGLERSRRFRDNIEKNVEKNAEKNAKRNAGDVDSRILDLQYLDIQEDPVAQVARIYEHFDLEFTDSAEARMRRFLKESPPDRFGKHRYHFMSTGLRLDEERRRFRGYQERFKVPTEKV